jgi:hypothetical protein
MAPFLVVLKNFKHKFFFSNCVLIDPFNVVNIRIELDVVVINLTQTKVD